jgi:hypothetical protein
MAIEQPKDVLQNEDAQEVQKLLGSPLFIPDEFKSWFADWFATNVPKLPISQVFGFKLDRLRSDDIALSETRNSSSYGDMATVGPSLTGLGRGFYLLIFGFSKPASDFNTTEVKASPSINGSTPVDADAARRTLGGSALRSLVVELPLEDNSVVLKYAVASGTRNIEQRFLHAFKVVDLDA